MYRESLYLVKFGTERIPILLALSPSENLSYHLALPGDVPHDSQMKYSRAEDIQILRDHIGQDLCITISMKQRLRWPSSAPNTTSGIPLRHATF